MLDVNDVVKGTLAVVLTLLGLFFILCIVVALVNRGMQS